MTMKETVAAECDFPGCTYSEESFIHRSPAVCVSSECQTTKAKLHDVEHHLFWAQRDVSDPEPVAALMGAVGRAINAIDKVVAPPAKPFRPLRIEALPGKLILRFPSPAERLGSGLIWSAKDWALRKEVGVLVSIGAATNGYERMMKREILKRAGELPWQKFRERHLVSFNRLTGWSRPRGEFIVSMAIGTYYYRDELRVAYGAEFDFLADIRVYNIGDLATSITEVCPTCQRVTRPDHEKCMKCGTPLHIAPPE